MDSDNQKNSAIERQYVIFKLGDEEFGVSISEVREIIRLEQITRIPNTSEYVKGVINLRGGIIIVLDLAMKMNMQRHDYNNNTRIIVIEVKDSTIGVVVDSATEVLRLSSDQIKPAPEVITKKINSGYLEGVGIVGDRLLILLDLEKIVEEKDLGEINQLKKSSAVTSKLAEIKEAQVEEEETAPINKNKVEDSKKVKETETKKKSQKK